MKFTLGKNHLPAIAAGWDVDGEFWLGFDTGPGNTLLDAWINEIKSENFDQDGAWAKTGTVSQDLLQHMLRDPYLAAPPPKSTGFEYFDSRWIHKAIEQSSLSKSPEAPRLKVALRDASAGASRVQSGRHLSTVTVFES